jgi:hypothetical protein
MVALRLLYGTDVNADLRSVLLYMNGFATGAGVTDTLDVDLAKLGAALCGIRLDFPHKDGLEKASVFKKVSNFIVNFVAERPIVSPFPPGSLDPGILKIPNHQNAVIAFELGIEALHLATVNRSDGDVVLKKRICVSPHSHVDIIEAISEVTPNLHFKLVSVLLEQLAYRANPQASYALLVSSPTLAPS